jgi:hypothetical protein
VIVVHAMERLHAASVVAVWAAERLLSLWYARNARLHRFRLGGGSTKCRRPSLAEMRWLRHWRKTCRGCEAFRGSVRSDGGGVRSDRRMIGAAVHVRRTDACSHRRVKQRNGGR